MQCDQVELVNVPINWSTKVTGHGWSSTAGTGSLPLAKAAFTPWDQLSLVTAAQPSQYKPSTPLCLCFTDCTTGKRGWPRACEHWPTKMQAIK